MLKQIYYYTIIVILSFSFLDARPLAEMGRHHLDANNTPSLISNLSIKNNRHTLTPCGGAKTNNVTKSCTMTKNLGNNYSTNLASELVQVNFVPYTANKIFPSVNSDSGLAFSYSCFAENYNGHLWVTGDSLPFNLGALVNVADTSDLMQWTLLNNGMVNSENTGINCLEFINSSTIFAGGMDGSIYKTTNGGSSWQVVYFDSTVTNFIDQIKFFDANHGIAWGDGLSSTSPQACLVTSDGGATWINNNSFIIGTSYSGDVSFVSQSDIFLSGYSSVPFEVYDGMWHSTDAGKTWSWSFIGSTSTDNSTYAYSIAFKDTLEGIAVKKDSTIWTTSNGGTSWEQLGGKLPTNFIYVNFISGTNIAVCGGIGNASIAIVDLDKQLITVYSDSTKKNDDVFYVNFPTVNSGYMCAGDTYILSASFLPVTSINEQESSLKKQFLLSQNYPNPFNPTTTINYTVPKVSFVTIKVYDALGRELNTLVNEEKSAGNYNVEFNASKLASGIYFYRMQAGNFVGTKKLILLK